MYTWRDSLQLLGDNVCTLITDVATYGEIFPGEHLSSLRKRF